MQVIGTSLCFSEVFSSEARGTSLLLPLWKCHCIFILVILLYSKIMGLVQNVFTLILSTYVAKEYIHFYFLFCPVYKVCP